MVKDPHHQGQCRIHYHDIGDYLDRESKLNIIDALGSTEALDRGVDLMDGRGVRRWQIIEPDDHGDWIEHRCPQFNHYIPLGDKKKNDVIKIFSIYSRGVATSRDAWCYNFSRMALENNIKKTINVYNDHVDRFEIVCQNGKKVDVETVIDWDKTLISWSEGLKNSLRRLKRFDFNHGSVRECMYRPFCKQWFYFSRELNEAVYQMNKIFPTERHENLVICVPGKGSASPFSVLVTNIMVDLCLITPDQCFPFYWYEEIDGGSDSQSDGLFQNDGVRVGRYIRREAITDEALKHFREYYNDETISKEDIFWYVYGVLHAPDYREKFAVNLKKEIPRIPLVEDFAAFRDAGKKLGMLHLSYEDIEPYPVTEEIATNRVSREELYQVKKMKFGKRNGEKDKSTIIYNAFITIKDIPLDAYRYQISGKSAIEWIMDRYQWRKDDDSGIVNDPNEWCRESRCPSYILDLLKRVIRVSVESVKIIDQLPKCVVVSEVSA